MFNEKTGEQVENLKVENINKKLKENGFDDVEYKEDEIGRRCLIITYQQNPDLVVKFLTPNEGGNFQIPVKPTKYKGLDGVIKKNIWDRARKALKVIENTDKVEVSVADGYNNATGQGVKLDKAWVKEHEDEINEIAERERIAKAEGDYPA